jgi:hypothetical protein
MGDNWDITSSKVKARFDSRNFKGIFEQQLLARPKKVIRGSENDP